MGFEKRKGVWGMKGRRGRFVTPGFALVRWSFLGTVRALTFVRASITLHRDCRRGTGRRWDTSGPPCCHHHEEDVLAPVIFKLIYTYKVRSLKSAFIKSFITTFLLFLRCEPFASTVK